MLKQYERFIVHGLPLEQNGGEIAMLQISMSSPYIISPFRRRISLNGLYMIGFDRVKQPRYSLLKNDDLNDIGFVSES
jgi:hypothetical protein